MCKEFFNFLQMLSTKHWGIILVRIMKYYTTYMAFASCRNGYWTVKTCSGLIFVIMKNKMSNVDSNWAATRDQSWTCFQLQWILLTREVCSLRLFFTLDNYAKLLESTNQISRWNLRNFLIMCVLGSQLNSVSLEVYNSVLHAII